MMPGHVVAVVSIAYVSLVGELAVLRVGSVASSASIWKADPMLVGRYSEKYQRLLTAGRSTKLLAAGPLVVVYAVFAFPIVAVGFGPDPLGDYVFTPSQTSELAGLALVVLGRVLALAAALVLRRREDRGNGPIALETSGPFRWSRNPGLVGMYVFVIGMWLVMPSAGFAVAIGIYAVYMDRKVRMEEDYLANAFGRRYLEYCMKTRRYLP